MEQKEFDQRASLINDLIKEAATLKNDIESTANKIIPQVKSLLPTMDNRDKAFVSYLNLLHDFSFSDKLTTPSDLFPGIRTVSEMSNPEELSQKADQMKNAAGEIEVLSKKSNLINNSLLQDLKRCIGLISEYMIQENQIYDLSIDLLNDADSIYDVGQLAKNT